MRTRMLRMITTGAVFLPLCLYQSCLVLLPDTNSAVVVDLKNIPHFDGDKEGSVIDALFGFDDDDDDDWDDDHDWHDRRHHR